MAIANVLYELAMRRLDDQSERLKALRANAGVLFAGASAGTYFLVGRTNGAGTREPWVLGLALIFCIGIICLTALQFWPTDWASQFSVSKYLEAEKLGDAPGGEEALWRALATQMDHHAEINEGVLWARNRFLKGLIFLTVCNWAVWLWLGFFGGGHR